jgi:hypothetical protein
MLRSSALACLLPSTTPLRRRCAATLTATFRSWEAGTPDCRLRIIVPLTHASSIGQPVGQPADRDANDDPDDAKPDGKVHTFLLSAQRPRRQLRATASPTQRAAPSAARVRYTQGNESAGVRRDAVTRLLVSLHARVGPPRRLSILCDAGSQRLSSCDYFRGDELAVVFLAVNHAVPNLS